MHAGAHAHEKSILESRGRQDNVPDTALPLLLCITRSLLDV
jgi:hypothetical protein